MSSHSDLKPFRFRRNTWHQKLQLLFLIAYTLSQSKTRKGLCVKYSIIHLQKVELICLWLIMPSCSVSLLKFGDPENERQSSTLVQILNAKIKVKGFSYWDFLILPSECYCFTWNWFLFGLIYLKIKLIYNQFSPHLNSDLQVCLQGSSRIREIMCCLSCSLKQNPSQTCAYGAWRSRDQLNAFTLLYSFLLILNLCVVLTRN